MAISMREIAKLAGVSAPAVSAVLKGSSQTIRVSAERAAKIKQIADELGYRSHWRSSIMRKGRTHLVGLVGTKDRITKTHNGSLLQGLEDELATHKLALTLVQTCPGHQELLLDGRFDGCLIDFVVLPEQIEAIHEVQLPGVIINAEPREGIPAVRLDENSAMVECVRTLRQLGHKRICYIDQLAENETSRRWGGELQRRRLRAWELATQNSGIDFSVAQVPSNLYDDPQGAYARSSVPAMLAMPASKRPTGFVSYNAVLGFTFCELADRMGLRCPADFSLVSMSDHELLKFWRTPISSISENFIEVGRKSAAQLQNLIISRREPKVKRQIFTDLVEADVLVQSTMVKRCSTAKPPQAS
jgi:LacI family transcriptional regulator